MADGDIIRIDRDGEPIYELNIKCPECGSPRAEPLNRRIVFVDYRCLDCGYEYLIDEIGGKNE